MTTFGFGLFCLLGFTVPVPKYGEIVYVLPFAADASPVYVMNVRQRPALDARRPDSV